MDGLELNISAYRDSVRSKYSQLNWEAIAHMVTLPVLVVTVATCNVKSDYYHKVFRLLAPAVTIASGIRLFFVAEEVNELSGKIATLNKQEELGLKQVLGTDHWRQGKVLTAIAQSDIAQYLPQEALALPPASPHPAAQSVPQSAAHYAPQGQQPAYGLATYQQPRLGNFDLNSLGEAQPTNIGFDWNKVRNFPHLLILGSTGSGKTTLTQWLISTFYSNYQVVIIDPHAKPKQWGDYTVSGAGRDYDAIEEAVSKIRSEMDKRYKKRSSGIEDWYPLVVVVDEYPAIVSNTTTVQENILMLCQEARKVDIVLIVLAQGQEVKTLGLEGKGTQRANFKFIELGEFAITKAKRLKDDRLESQLENYPRSCLVDEQFAIIPDLSNFRSGNSGNYPGNDGKLSPANNYDPTAVTLETFPVSDFQGQNQGDQTSEMETRMVQILLDKGLSDTEIIKSVFNIKSGRRWDEGKQKLLAIKQRLGIADRPLLEIEEEVEKAKLQDQIYALWQQGIQSPEDVISQIWGVAPGSSDWAGTLGYYQRLVGG